MEKSRYHFEKLTPIDNVKLDVYEDAIGYVFKNPDIKDVAKMEESKYHFEKLTPIDNVELDVYEDAIDFAFENSDIKNVAISGAYSSGKSSILASYKKKHPEQKFLHISLAHFKSPDEEDNEERTDVKVSVLEGKILNQLIHQIPTEKIPQTNFRVKKQISRKRNIISTLEAVLFVIAIIFVLCFNMWKNYLSALPDNWLKTTLLITTHPYILIVDAFIIIFLLSLAIYKVIKVQKNKNIFRKLNFQGNEIEVFAESDDSFFDKYLNEVLYLFENVDADVIVFEDMDRFNANIIFERLREVNTLTNIRREKENKKVLRFFYLLRDDIFVSKDRTKFFDYIIPVVPVVDSTNSYNKFIEHFKNSGIYEKFDENFLQGLSLYIDDMRLLKNIYNEFVVYYNRLNITELDCNKMLAIIAYKNLFPRDFADLQLNQGFVYTLFDSKDSFIAEEVEKLDKQISKKSNEIDMAKNEHLSTIKELDAAYEDKRPVRYGYKQDLSDTDKANYAKRKQAIENRLNNSIPKLENEKLFLERKRISIQNKQLCEIITRDNIDSIFSITSTNEIGVVTDFNEIKSSEYFDLLKYLIRNGHIDETYADYMTYFYENSLSCVDKIFLRSITDKKAKEYSYKLKNTQMVISRLRLVDFDQEEILNYDLLTYLLTTLTNIEYLEKFIDQLKSTKNFKFIGGYLDTTTELPNFIKYLNMRWPEAFATALSKQSLTDDQIRKYSICSIYYSDDDTIQSVNKDDCLRDYISNARDYLTIDNPNIDNLIHGFDLLEVSFTGFDYTEANKELFDAVYEESLYEINTENLLLIQKEVLGIKSDEDILHKNYTILCSKPDSAITKFVNWDINKYIDVVMQISDGTILDDENVAIKVLNNYELDTENKSSYISALKTIITSIKEITDSSLWSMLLDAEIIQYSERNIMDYFIAIGLDDSLIAYINRNNTKLNFSKINDSDNKGKLFNEVVKCDSIKNSKYKQILVSLNRYYKTFTITDIPDDKITILIDTSIVRMTAESLRFVRENYPEQKYHFINKNIEEYVDIMDVQLFSQDELLEILTWNISDELKIKLLEFSDDEISIIGKNYSTTVCLHILNNNFMESDLIKLFSSFDEWEDSVQTRILDYAISNLESIIKSPNCVSERLKNDILHSDNVSRDKKIDLFISMMPNLSEKHIEDVLKLLDLSDYLKIFDVRSRPKFEINSENKKLLTAFKENSLINNFEENSDKSGYYKIIRIKPTKS